MADAENFEDDLFADLYEDTETGSKPAAPAPASTQPASAESNVNGLEKKEPAAQSAGDIEASHGDEMNEDNEEDEDDVDFNLGGGTSGSADQMSHSMQHDDTPSTPPYGTVHRASAKEDG
ncbi:hypothetical protein ESCO_005491 [Escovopsis weberi]|uniref:Uncharacterized protein n=1 Tax=Escovopsis weberi TaxID=150374 RepID=A0A0M8N4J1_ESCWE|nr:hypothetical protein ESCO_005491 [Escovopsis weberi]